SNAVKVMDQLPAGLTFERKGSSPGCSVQDGTGAVRCSIGTVEANSSVTITIVATVAPDLSSDAITFTNTASATANKDDDNTRNDASNTVTTTQPGIGAPPGGTSTIARQISELIFQIKTACAKRGVVSELVKTQRALARNHVKEGCDHLAHFARRLEGVRK